MANVSTNMSTSEDAGISNSVGMFYNESARVSGTSVPTYYWSAENGNAVVTDVGLPANTEAGAKKYGDIQSDIYAPFSLFHDYSLMYYSGMNSFIFPPEEKDKNSLRRAYLDNEYARTVISELEPTYHNIIEVYNSLDTARYKPQDFIYNKYYGEIPPNYLITLRRYPGPCSDLAFSLTWDDETQTEMYTKSAMPVMCTATTYLSETAGNKLDDILHMNWGTKWEEKTAAIQAIQSGTPGATAFGIGSWMEGKRMSDSTNPFGKAAAATGLNLLFIRNYTYANMRNAQAIENIDPWSKYANYAQGPTDVVDSTKVRGQGLTFTNDYSLKFAYELKSLRYVNPKIAMLDIISNMVSMGTTAGTWFGGATRYFGNGGGWGDQIGDVNMLKNGNYLGYFKSVSNNIQTRLNSMTKDGAFNFWSGADWKAVLSQFLKLGVDNLVGSLIDGKLGQVGMTTPANALLSGDPTGYWHVTIGNPLNPILMMGNMICNSIDMTLGEGLGYDDFPVNVEFTAAMTHGKPRDAGDIESMFNAGKGRLYLSPLMGGDEKFSDKKIAAIKNMNDAINNARDPNHIGKNVGKKGNGTNRRANAPMGNENTGKILEKWSSTVTRIMR